jgi:hypothetical protein
MMAVAMMMVVEADAAHVGECRLTHGFRQSAGLFGLQRACGRLIERPIEAGPRCFMTPEAFREIALALPDASESSHLRHPDFRVHGKIFATLGYPTEAWGMVKLLPKHQDEFITFAPAIFSSVKGYWGQRGATHVKLSAAKKANVRKAMHAAWNAITPKGSPKNAAKRRLPGGATS